MLNKYILPISLIYLGSKFFLYKKESQSIVESKNSCKFTESLFHTIHKPIIKGIEKILLKPEINTIITNSNTTTETPSGDINLSKIDTNIFNINISELIDNPNYDLWIKEKDATKKKQIYNNLIKGITSRIIKSSDIKSDDVFDIIDVYIKSVFINTINNNINKLNKASRCLNKNRPNTFNDCIQIIQKLKSLYEIPNFNSNKKNLLTQALIIAHNSYNNKVSNKCNNPNFNKEFNLDNNLVKKLSMLPINAENIEQEKLDQMSLNANKTKMRQKISDLTLKELVFNTNTIILSLLDNPPRNIEDISNFVLKDDNIFYIGIFFISFAIIMYAMMN